MHTAIINARTLAILLASLIGFFISITAAEAVDFDSGIFDFQQKLANNDNPQAQYKLAGMYETGRGTEKNLNLAKKWYQKSAANKYRPAEHRLTYLEIKRTGFKATHKNWLKDLSADAKQGDVEAMFLLGEMSETGIGVKKNLKQAKVYYKAASNRGNVNAENRLYYVEDKLNRIEDAKLAKRQQKLAAAEEKKKQKEAQSKANKQKNVQQNNQKQQAQLKIAQERKRLKAERLRLVQERQKLEAQQRALEKKEMEAKIISTQVKEPEAIEPQGFESNLCTGRAAKFRTQCK